MTLVDDSSLPLKLLVVSFTLAGKKKGFERSFVLNTLNLEASKWR